MDKLREASLVTRLNDLTRYQYMPAKVRAALSEAALALQAAEARALAVEGVLRPFAFLDLHGDPLARWDNESRVMVEFPSTRIARPTAYVHVSDIRRAREVLAHQKAQELGSLQLEDQGSLRPAGLRPCGANSEVATDWQTIESAPKDGTYVLLYGPARGTAPRADLCHAWGPVRFAAAVTEGYFAAGFWQVRSHVGEPTHWQPLPSPPTQPASRDVATDPAASSGEQG